MRRSVTLVGCLLGLTFGASHAASAQAPVPSDDAVVLLFIAWAESQGMPVSRVACHIDDTIFPNSAVCYGMADGPTAIGASAILTPDASTLEWDEFEPANPAAAPPISAEAQATTSTSPTTTPITTTTVAPPTAPPTTTAPTTTVPAFDPLVPVEPGANGPVVAAIQGRLGVNVDCDFGNQTRSAVEEWQATAGIPVTGTIDELSWTLLDVPTTWGNDVNGNGTIEPSEVTLVCDGNVELPPPPVDTTGWPNTILALVAETCSIPDEFTYPNDEGPDARYSPNEDTITILGAGAEDYPDRGDLVFDTMVCVLGSSGVPERVISQISSTRALDGMQFAEWDGLAAQWNYHPDAGMNLTIYST